MDELEKEEIQQSEGLENFILSISPKLHRYLQHNTLLDIFKNDYSALQEEEIVLVNGTQTILQEYQSFTDLFNSKDKCLTCIEWHPVQKGVVAVSCSPVQGYDDRISRISSSKKHVIIIWSFQDPILPQVVSKSK
jgi:dynein intermediate chain 3, axonemal